MIRSFTRTAIATALLVSAVPLRADIPPDTGTPTSTVRRNLPAWEVPSTAFKMGLVSTAILSAAEPESALARASILTPRLHGNVGEALVSSQLHATGGWTPIRPRNGPQGIDHVWIKYDKTGRPVDMIVGETKYGTSRLGMTKFGRQMNTPWKSNHLADLADDWDAMAKDIAAQSGTAKARQFRLTADFLRAAAEGSFSYRSEIYRVKIDGNVAKISVQRLGPDGIAIGRKRPLPPIQIKGRPARIVKAQLIGEIQEIYPTLKGTSEGQAEARRLANRMYAEAKTTQAALARGKPAIRLVGTTGAVLAVAGLVAGGSDLAAQLLSRGNMDWNRAGTMVKLGAISSGSAEAAQLATSQALLRNAAFRTRSLALGRRMGLSALRTRALLPKAVGGPFAVLAFSYGGYAFGRYDIKDAHRNAIEGAVGLAAGGLAHAGILGIASAWGTASTGTAISTLSGAAANSAQLAWLGCGGGMAWGSAVLWTGVAVAAVAAGAAVWYGFYRYDKAKDWERVGNTIEVLRTHTGDFPGNPWANKPAATF